MEDIRAAIMEDRFLDFYNEFNSKYEWGHGGEKQTPNLK